LGYGALAVAIAAFITWSALGWVEFLYLAIGLLVCLLAAIGFTIGKQSYDVSLDIARLRVRVGESAFGKLQVSNPTARRQFSAEITVPIGKNTVGVKVPGLAPRAVFDEIFQIPTHKRAVIPLGPVCSARGDGLGLLSRQVQWVEVQDLFVHPQIVPIEGAAAGFVADLEGRATKEQSTSDVAFHALRDYEVGDDLRHIHWKTVARVGKLMVRQFDLTKRSHLVVALGMRPDEYADDDSFELAVSVAASLAIQAIRDDHDLAVVTADRELHHETPTRLLDDCSALEFGGPSDPIALVARRAVQTAPDASMAILVVGSKPTPTQMMQAIVPFGVDTRVLVIRCEPGLKVARRSIATTPVITLGDLADLPRALRAVEL
jgi:uncharacterized protein (DUF58 family)